MTRPTRREFLKVSATAAAATSATVQGVGCAHHPVAPPGEKGAGGAAPATETVEVRTTVNGERLTLKVHPEEVALTAVREHVGLTGSKLACGHGACGACTMQLDGTPVATCILPATSLQDREVTTVEGLAHGEALHAVQRAFIEHDALQCGFCTPGFVTEAAAFVDAWRKSEGTREPDRDTVADALCGHLCRCGAYDQIYTAVIAACRGDHDDSGNVSSPRNDAYAKVTGRAQYTVDVRPKGLLHVKALHAPVGHAKIGRLDWSKARAMPGVRGLVDLIEGRTIRYSGQHLVAVAAETERIAEAAIDAIEVDYETLDAAVGMDRATAPDAPLVYRGRERRHPPNANETPLLPAKWSANVRGPLKLFSKMARTADREIERAREQGRTVSGTFESQAQCHTCLEPHAVVAHFHGGKLTVHMSTQAVSAMNKDIAERWGMEREDVTVIADYVGGGFGSKATLTQEVVIAIELSRLTARPVRYVYDRRQELILGGYRPAARIELDLATDKAGEMTGMRAITRSDAGVAVGHVCGLVLRLIYPLAPRRLEDWDVTTHAPPGKPFRGPGGPQAFFALEQSVDQIAHDRGEDPLAVRRRWDPNEGRRRLYDWAETIPAWRDRSPHGTQRGRYRRGIGLAGATWMVFTEPKARVEITAGRDGVIVRQSSQDTGNGTRSVLADSVAAELGLHRSEITVEIGDSRYIHGPMSAGSRTTSSIAPACADACAKLRDELVDLAKATRGVAKAKAGATGVEHEGGTIPYRELIASADPPIVVVGRRRRSVGGFALPPILGLATERAVATGVVLTEVEVDTRLGRVRVVESWAGFNAGRIVAPVIARSQATGGVIQAISYTLYEERRLDPHAGFMLTGGLEDYRIIGVGDVGPVHVHFDEEGFDRIPGRQVGLSELTTLAPPAAIGNAIYHATGWRPRQLPIRPDRVLQGVRA